MKQSSRLVCFVGVIALCALDLLAGQPQPMRPRPGLLPASQTTPTTAEEVLRRALEARGGEAAAARIRSYQCKGTVDLAWGGRCDYESFAARPNQEREVFSFGGSRYDFACDGQVAWHAEPGIAPEARTGEMLRESRDAAAWFACYDDPRAFRSIVYTGETRFEGKRCYELKLITASGLEQTHYYNATNYLLAGVVERVTTETGPSRCTTCFLEYREFAGFWFPTRFRRRMEEGEYVIRVNSVQVNRVDGSAFSMPATAAAPAATPSCAGLSDAEIKTILRDWVETDKIGVGLVVGLVDPQSSRVISCGKLANGNSPEVNGDTLFEIGSITKVFTRVLLHDMIARGQMNLDDPVQKYLPASVRMPARHGKQITLWDLTTHTSGLPREMGGPQTVERLYAFLRSYQLPRDPGEELEYSNVGVALLGHVIVLRAGQDYETLVRERICRPLKMDSTAIKLTLELQARRATGHAPASHPQGYIGLQDLPGAGALFSSANDMLKFAAATLGLTPCAITPALKKVCAGHNGGTFGFSSLLALDPKPRRGLVVLSNCRDDDMVERLRAVLKNQSPKPSQTTAVSASACDQYVGQYHAKGDRVWTVRREGDRLLLQECGRPCIEVFAQSETNFYNQLFDCQATFARDVNTGLARELTVGGWRGERIAGQILTPSGPPLTDNDCPPRPDSDAQGVWKATYRPWYWPFFALHLVVRVAELSPGAFRAEADSPEQDVKGQPLAVLYNRPNVEVVVLPSGGDSGWFEGQLNPAHTKVKGLWRQAGHTIHLTFSRSKAPTLPKASP